MIKKSLYVFLPFWFLANQAMEADQAMRIDYDDYLETALRSEFLDLPETETVEQLELLYLKKIRAEFYQLLINKIPYDDDEWFNFLRKLSYIDTCSDILELALAQGINPNKIDIFGNTALYCACYFEAIKNVNFLLKYKADVNLKAHCETCLIAAVKIGNFEIVRLLLSQKNININAQKPKSKNTAIIIAVKKYNKKYHPIILALLNAKADPNIANEKNENAIDLAQKKGFLRLANSMKNYKPRTKTL